VGKHHDVAERKDGVEVTSGNIEHGSLSAEPDRRTPFRDTAIEVTKRRAAFGMPL
jgi:hypothetical protein